MSRKILVVKLITKSLHKIMDQDSKNATKPTDRRNIEFYLGVDKVEDKFTMFNKWCKQEGVIMPKVEYPAFFEHGLLGVKVTQDIEHREAFLYIPLKMVFSVEKARQQEELVQVINSYHSLFDPKNN